MADALLTLRLSETVGVELNEIDAPVHLCGTDARRVLYRAASEWAGGVRVICAGHEAAGVEFVDQIEELIRARTAALVDHGAVNVTDFRSSGLSMDEIVVLVDTPPAAAAGRFASMISGGNRVGVRAVVAHAPLEWQDGFSTNIEVSGGEGRIEHAYRSDLPVSAFTY